MKKSPETLVGSIVQVWAANYIYTGKLASIDDEWIHLTGCGVVYETGELTQKKPKTVEAFLSSDRWIDRRAVESLGAASA